MRYKYVAYTSTGKKIAGQSEGEQREVLRELRNKGLSVVEVSPVEVSAKGVRIDLKLADLASIFARLAYLLENGVKVDRSLQIVLRSNPDSRSSEFLEDISLRVSGGETLHDALSHYSAYIDQVYLAGIKLGEEIGALAPTFRQIAESIESRLRLQKDVAKAMTYPAAVFAFSILSLFFIFNFIVPKIGAIFEGVEELPWYTNLLMSTSEFVVQNQLAIILGTALAIVGAVYWLREPANKQRMTQWLFSVPYLRRFVTMADQIRFCSSMSLGLSSGLLVHQAVEISSQGLKNRYSSHAAQQAAKQIRDGLDPAEALIDAHVMPSFHAALIEVTQDSDSLGRAFGDITAKLQDEMENAISRMVTLLEPLLIAVMGVIIGGIVLVMMLSIMSIQDVGL